MRTITLAAVLAVMCAAPALAQPDVLAQVQAAEKQMESGDLDGATVALEKVVASTARSLEARAGSRARAGFAGAPRPGASSARRGREACSRRPTERRAHSPRDFVCLPVEAGRGGAVHTQRAFDAQIQSDNRGGAAGLANGLGRIYLESGNVQKAEQWYMTGYETAKKIQGITPTESALWEMRRHNALGRVAARRGDKAGAAWRLSKHSSTRVNTNQRSFYPYLVGYVAFFAKDYRQGAIDELTKGDQNDPFVLALIAQSHEKLGQRDQAGAEVCLPQGHGPAVRTQHQFGLCEAPGPGVSALSHW